MTFVSRCDTVNQLSMQIESSSDLAPIFSITRYYLAIIQNCKDEMYWYKSYSVKWSENNEESQ